MQKHIFSVIVAWGDCDEAGVVFYPNYFYWMDSAFQALMRSHGLDQRKVQSRFDIVGVPVITADIHFMKPVTYENCLEVSATIENWSAKTFHVRYKGFVDDMQVFDSSEKRFLGERIEDGRLRAIAIPEEFRKLFES